MGRLVNRKTVLISLNMAVITCVLVDECSLCSILPEPSNLLAYPVDRRVTGYYLPHLYKISIRYLTITCLQWA